MTIFAGVGEMASLIAELKRRNVFKVGVAYAIVAWLLVQIIVAIETPLNLPDWVDTLTIILLAIGFPVALIFAWAFELTPEGIKTTKSVNPEESITDVTGQKLNHVITGVLSLAIVFIIVDSYLLDDVAQVTETQQQTEVSAPSDTITITESPGSVDTSSDEPERLPNSVAVLPFENLSPDPDNAYFAAGIHESTLNQLAKIRELTVMARTSVMQFENDPPPIPEIAEALNVETVMEGSVRYAEGRVLITAQLIDGITGAHLWSDEFNRELIDIFSMQAEVAEEIARAMQVQLLPEDLAKIENRPTESDEAYMHYLQAMSLPFPLSRPEFLPGYINSLERAIAADPNFAEPYAELAALYTPLGETELATSYAERAIELDPLNGAPYISLGYASGYFYDRLEEAQAYLERGIELSPNNPQVMAGYCYRASDNAEDYDELIRICRRAVEIDPIDLFAHRRFGAVLMRAGNLTEAAEQFNEAIEIDPVNIHESYFELAMVEYLRGNFVEARRNLDNAINIISPDADFRIDTIPYVYGLIGDTDRAIELFTRFAAQIGEVGPQQDRNLGWAALGTRDKDLALNEWTRTVNGYLEDGWPVSSGRIARFRDNWLNDPMLEEPEFLELRQRLILER